MTLVERFALLRFGAEQMYALVGDVEAYPQFLPGCIAAAVEHATDDHVRARLGFRVRGLEDSFATENRMLAPARIDVRLVDGPFRHLSGYWSFQPLDEDACKVSLRLQMDIGSRVLEKALGPWIDHGVNATMDAFRARAESLYGQKK